MEYPKHTTCMLCGKGPLTGLKGYERHYLVKCRNCGFVFIGRIPTVEELEAFYGTYAYGHEQYLSPITVQRYHELLDEFEPYRKTGRLIDVGCGQGFFLTEAAKRGWEVYGTEYSAAAVDYCASKGIRMTRGKLDASHWPAGFFDVVTSFEVLEHINNPNEELEQMKQLLRPGGLFYATTPNFDALNRYLLRADYNMIIYPEHLSYYTAGTLHRLLAAHGFVKKKVQVTGISLTRIRQAYATTTAPVVSKDLEDEKMRVQIEKRPLLRFIKSAVNSLLTLTRTGITLKVYYTRGK
jgi:SAM-dependent methyltransferase